jgi:leader peptidase (prepilin peptidase)/N-methyltransferase
VAAVLLVVPVALLGVAVGALVVRLAGGFPWDRGRFGPPAVPSPAAELVAGALFAVVAVVRPAWDLPAFLFLVAVGLLLALVDLRHRLLPNRVLVPAYAVSVALLTVAAAAQGEWSRLARAGAGAVVLFAAFLVLALVAPSGLGMGDVKLAALLGLHLGWLGWRPLVLGATAGFVVQALVAVVLLTARRVDREGALPFGPAMLAGALLAIGWAAVPG